MDPSTELADAKLPLLAESEPLGHRLVSRFWMFRPAPFAVLAALVLHVLRHAGNAPPNELDSTRALARALEMRGLHTAPADIHWIDEARGLWVSLFEEPRAVLLAHRNEEPADVYLVETRLSPEGKLMGVTGVHNLSDTSAVDEQKLVHDGERVGWVLTNGTTTESAHYADLRGEPPLKGAGWTRLARIQNALTNLQNTGALHGIGRRSFKLTSPASTAALGFDSGAFLVEADGHAVRIPTEGSGEIKGAAFVEEHEQIKARPGNVVTWAVDRVRALPWFGSDRMQALKAIAFAGLDWLERTQGAVTGDDGAQRVAEEIAGIADKPATTYTDPETGFPPPPLEPVLSRPLEGEGKWVLLDNDPFIKKNPGAPPPFAFSFLRTDHERAYTQTYIALWDPRQVSLHCMSGTVEPKSATGETGPGLVPRTPAVMRRLLAGFNGGFQAQHGEYGMMAEGVVYLPPKPYAATVAELRDGSSAFGTWPNAERVPSEIISFRQNMSPLIMDGVKNPYKRAWWGGVPPGWTDESRTVRSGLCLTKEGFVAYFYGSSIDADHLTIAMERARCIYGIHLDMNPGHTGLEFYNADEVGHLPEVGHVLDSRWEARGAVSSMPGWEFLGRRMIRFMGLMNFPRYISRESRDFFYLTLRDVLPGNPLEPALKPAQAGEGAWQVKGLPQHGWPYAMATTWLRPDAARGDARVNVLKLDGNVLAASDGKPHSGGEADTTVVVFPSAAKAPGKAPSVWFGPAGFTIAERAPDDSASLVASGFAPSDVPAQVVAGAGTTDWPGTLVYVELATPPKPGADAALLDGLLKRLGCTERVLFDHALGIALGGSRDLAGHGVPAAKGGLRLMRAPGPGGRRIFPDTPIVPVKVWYTLQAKRVRYFRRPEAPKTASSGGAASEAPPSSASSAKPGKHSAN